MKSRYPIKTILAAFLLLWLCWLCFGFFIPINPNKKNFTNCEPQHKVWVVSHGYHTGIVISAEDLQKSLQNRLNLKGNYYEIGWGDRDFYMASGYSWSKGAKAMLWPSEGIMHVAAFDVPPQKNFTNSDVKEVTVCREQLDSMQQYIFASFKLDEEKNFTSPGKGLYGRSKFYEAHGSYSVFYTCNTWISDALRKAGIVTPMWSGTAPAIMRQL